MIEYKKQTAFKWSLVPFFIVLISLFSFLIPINQVQAANSLKGELQNELSQYDSLNVIKNILNRSKPIYDDQKRFADYDFYDETVNRKISDELKLKGKIVAVPRKFAIQNGEFLNGDKEEGSPNARHSEWRIEGEYGFVPTFSPSTEISYYKKNKSTGKYDETVIYEVDKITKVQKKVSNQNVLTISAGEDVIIKYTNLGFYKGEPVSMILTPKLASHGKQASIGLIDPTVAAKSNPRYGMMSVSQTGHNTLYDEYNVEANSDINNNQNLFNQYDSAYVEMKYNFHNSNGSWDANTPIENKKSAMQVRGFYTYGDFDFEESIGISDEINIHNLYILQAGDDPYGQPITDPIEIKNNLPIKRITGNDLREVLNVNELEKNFFSDSTVNDTYKDDPLGIYTQVRGELIGGINNVNNKNPIQQYLKQYASQDSDWMNQLSFSTVEEDGKTFRYFNRGDRVDTEEYRIANWLSFTYDETQEFTLKVNASGTEDFDPFGNQTIRKAYYPTYDLFMQRIYDYKTTPSKGGGNEPAYIGRNKMLYKIMERKLRESGRDNNQIGEILQFEAYESNYQFNENTDNDKVVIGYNKNDVFLKGKYDPNITLQDQLMMFYSGNYEKYIKQQVTNSSEEAIMDFLYDMLTRVDPSKGPYSAYGYNKNNIGNFYSLSSLTAAKEASYTKANEGTVLLNGHNNYSVNGKSNRGMPQLIDFMLRPYFNGQPKYVTSDQGENPNTFGSNVYYTASTILPIGFPAPIKQVISDDKMNEEAGKPLDNIITWRILQDVPPLIMDNNEPRYIFEDNIPKGLIVNKNDIVVRDLKTNAIETNKWNITVTNNKVTIKPQESHLAHTSFYNRSFEIIIPTKIDESSFNGLTMEEIENNYKVTDDGYLEVKNIGTLTMEPRTDKEKELILHTRPDYSIKEDTKTPTLGYLKLKGDLDITKYAQEDPSKFLNGATFEIQNKESPPKKIAEGTTSKIGTKDGRLILKDVPIGNYKLVETVAPTGYQSIKPIDITLYPFKAKPNFLEIANELGRTTGEFEEAKKEVYDVPSGQEKRKEINDQLISFDETIEYEITTKMKEDGNKTELKEVLFKDTLDKGLTKVDGTTEIIVVDKTNGTEIINKRSLDDNKVWNGNQLDTSEYKDFDLMDGITITLKFKAKVNHHAGKKVINKASIKGSGNSKEGTKETREAVTNLVTNNLGEMLNIRQVILTPNNKLAIPNGENKGFVRLNNIDDTNNLFSSVSVTVPSSDKDSVSDFKAVFISPVKESKLYELQVIVPEMYRYVGYVISKEQSLDITKKKDDIPIIDISKNEGNYITLLIEPLEQNDPFFYNWDYKLNEFNKLLKVQ